MGMGSDSVSNSNCYNNDILMKKTTLENKIDIFFREHIGTMMFVARLGNYNIEFSYGTPEDTTEFRGTRSASMTMDLDAEYLVGRLHINRDVIDPAFKKKEYSYLLKLLSHELAHILTGEFADKLKIKYTGDGKYYQERLTEHVGRFIYKLYVVNMKDNNIDISNGKPKKDKRRTKNITVGHRKQS